MAIVVEQTVPFPPSSLDLQNPQRWHNLLTLIRPSLKIVRLDILVDQALAESKSIHIATVGTLGNFSSKLLDDHTVTAIATEHPGLGKTTAQAIQQAIQTVGAKSLSVVVIRAGKRRNVKAEGEDVLEVESQSEIEQDHIIQLLGGATELCQTSLHHSAELLDIFVKNASVAHSKFHVEKAEGNPAVLHADGAVGFEKAKHAVERDLKHAMKAHSAQDGQVTYSVHYSDVNGLSRLENYIIAGEIATYLDSQNIPYRLSHSTVLDHTDAARGFSISICPVPAQYLAAQAKPQIDIRATTVNDQSAQKPLAPSKVLMSFDDAVVRERIQSGCEAVIKAESIITEYDTIVGDGDCGYTLRDGAKQVLAFIRDKDLSGLPEVVGELVSELEINMGGTSGALYCIYLTALAGALASEPTLPKALQAALQQLMKYTRARLGDRTMMDALIPFVETLESTGLAEQAIERSEKGVEGTKTMEAKLGRSAYLDESATQGVPDPGAYGLLVLLKGMCNSE